jgi:hypothetical protein
MNTQGELSGYKRGRKGAGERRADGSGSIIEKGTAFRCQTCLPAASILLWRVQLLREDVGSSSEPKR